MLVIETELKRVEAVEFSPCGQFVAAGGAGVELWSLDCERHWKVGWDHKIVRGQAQSQYVRRVLYHPNGEFVTALMPGLTLQQIRVRDTQLREYRSEGQPFTHVDQSRVDGRIVACSRVELSSWIESPPLRSLRDRRVAWEISLHGLDDRSCYGVALLPDGQLLSHEVWLSGSPHFCIREPVEGECVKQIPCSYHQLDFFSACTDGEAQFVIARRGNKLLIWQLEFLHRPPRTLMNDTPKAITDFAMHPSGRYLATASNDRSIKLWEFPVTGEQPIRSFDWHGGRMRCIAFSPDGLIAAVGGDSGQLILFDVDL